MTPRPVFAASSAEADAATTPAGSGTPRLLLARVLAALLVVLLCVASGFVMWATVTTARSADRATWSSDVSDAYTDAARALAAEESLERKYRLEPGPDVAARYRRATGDLLTALDRVRAIGDSTDRAEVSGVLSQHARYLEATTRMFAAVDRGEVADVLRIDNSEVDPHFDAVEKVIDAEAEDHLAQTQRARAELRSLIRFNLFAIPVIILAGMSFAATLGLVLRRLKQAADAHHASALHRSLHDGLTGLPNRTLLATRFDEALRAGGLHGSMTGLLLIDLDRFKEINDTLGHRYGDELLTGVGPRLLEHLRAADTVARLGGDEFAVLLPDIGTVDAAVEVAALLRAALLEAFVIDGIELDVEASIGVALSGLHGEDADTLLQRADIAMYVAKQQGLGVSVYDPDTDVHSPERLSLLADLRRGLDRGELVLHYQPKIDLGTGAVTGAEALIRWHHPVRGMIPPDQFIPLAEHTGLIGPLTGYVIDSALTQVRDWINLGHPIPVAINLSARNLLDDQIVGTITDLLARHGVPAGLLQVEVTESAIMLEPDHACRILAQLHAMGIRIAIDDFGAGYTSLAQLKTLPVDELKIDRSFVTTMDTDTANAVIVRSVIDLARNLGKTTTAEGVETHEAMTALTDLGCDLAQGYHLSRPLAPDAFLTWYQEARTPHGATVAESA